MTEEELEKDPDSLKPGAKKKFSIKEFQGDRVRVPVPGCMNIRRIYNWNSILKKYVEPVRGARYEARRSNGATGNRETRNFNSLQEAREWQIGRNFNPADENQTSTGVQRDGYLIKDLLNDWQRLAWPNFRASTRQFYLCRIKYFQPLFNIPVESLTPKIIDEWIALLKHPEMLKTYKSTRSSLDKELRIFQSMIGWYLETNDETKMVSPFKKRHKTMAIISEKKATEVKYLTSEEFLLFLEKLKEYSVMYWALAITQQAQVLRISEAAAMKWPNLDLASRSYRIAEHVMWARIKGEKPQIAGGTKTNRSGEAFYTPLRQSTIDALQEIETLKCGDLIFHENGEVLTYRRIQHAYDKAFIKAGLTQRSTHVLRHTGATLFLEETGDALALQQLGNWRDQKMAQHYGKILSSRARNAIEKAEKRSALRLVHNQKNDEAI